MQYVLVYTWGYKFYDVTKKYKSITTGKPSQNVKTRISHHFAMELVDTKSCKTKLSRVGAERLEYLGLLGM